MPVLNVMTAWPTLMLVVVIVALNAAFAYGSIYLGDASIYDENGLMENLQVVFLALACCAYAYHATKLHGRHRLLAAFLALLMFAFVFRELDVDKMAVPQLLIFLLAEQGRALYFTPLVLMFALLLKDIGHYWRFLGGYLSSPTLVYFLIGAVLLIVFSTAFDKKWIGGAYTYYGEEAVELAATVWFFVSGLCAGRDFERINASIQ